MKVFVYKVVTLSLPIMLLLLVVNYVGDAARLFDTEYEKRMAEIIVNDSNVTNITNYDDRILQYEIISRIDDPPQIVILGSSRTMLISSYYFPKKTTFNNSVSGASIEDLIAIYQMYKERSFYPEKVIIGIDPWIFNENNGLSRWKSIQMFYKSFLKNRQKLNYSISDNTLQKYTQLFSFSYFQSSIKSLPKKFLGKSRPISTQEKFNATNTKLRDGSLIYRENYRNASQDEVNSKIDKYILDKVYSIENFEQISKSDWEEFQLLISDFKKNNVVIELFLCPYAPFVYKTIIKKYPKVVETEKIVKEYAQLENIKVWGSFNPIELEMNETYFYDGMHLKEKGIEKILKGK